MSKKLFATLADARSLSEVKTSLTSVLANGGLPADTQLMLLTTGTFPKKYLPWFKQRNIIIKKVKPLKKGDLFPDIYQSVFYLFSKEVKETWDQVVFIEADTLIVNDISPLFQVKKFAAVTDVFLLEDQFLHTNEVAQTQLTIPSLRKKHFFSHDFKETITQLGNKFDVHSTTFNAGVFAFPTRCIKSDARRQLKILVDEYYDVSRFGMQGILNLYFYQQWRALPNKYNSMVNLKTWSWPLIELSSAAILHFAGSLQTEKPWNNSRHPYFKTWQSYTRLSEKQYSQISVEKKPSRPYQKTFRRLQSVQKQIELIVTKTTWIASTQLIYRPLVHVFLLVVVLLKNKSPAIRQSSQPARKRKATHAFVYHSSARDLYLTVASILSVHNYAPDADFVVYGEGLNAIQRLMLRFFAQRVGSLRILTEQDITHLATKLQPYKQMADFFSFGWSGRKCFLPLLLDEYQKTILVDSDTLFVHKPTAILNWINSKTSDSLFLSDYMNFSVVSSVEMQSLLKRKPRLSRVNSGLICFNLQTINAKALFKDIDRAIPTIVALAKDRTEVDYVDKNPLTYVFPVLEQTLHWLMLEKIPSKKLPEDTYIVLPRHVLYGESVMRAVFIHYTGDQLRYHLYRHLFYTFLYMFKNRIPDLKLGLQQFDKCFRCNHPSTPFWYQEL